MVHSREHDKIDFFSGRILFEKIPVYKKYDRNVDFRLNFFSYHVRRPVSSEIDGSYYEM